MSGFGSMLRDYLEYYKISQSEFADRLGITQKHMNEMINGKTKISPELMILISLLTDIDVNLIYFAEKRKEVYESLMNEYKNEKEINKMLNSYYLKEMYKRKWINLKQPTSFVQNYMDLIEYLGINEISSINNYLSKRFLFKKASNDTDNIKIYLWIRHCDKETKGIEIGKYDSSKLNDLLNELKEERIKKFNKESLIKIFHKYGIILYIEDALPGTKVRGCIKVAIDTPVIYMTTYLKEKSSFYYTLYHELMHLKSDYNKLKSKTIVDEDDTEDEMNKLALNEMIDDKTYQLILNNYSNKEKIAEYNRIPLSFLYSRLAKEGIISYKSSEYMKNIERI